MGKGKGGVEVFRNHIQMQEGLHSKDPGQMPHEPGQVIRKQSKLFS